MLLERLRHLGLLEEIERVDTYLHERTSSDPVVDDMTHYATAGGQRARSLMVLLGCEAVGGDRRHAIPAAAAVELLHKASLVHDDLVDGDDLRRGRQTFHRRYGWQIAVIEGDLLVALAFDSLGTLSEVIRPSTLIECYRVLGCIFQTMCMGEMKDISKDAGSMLNEAECLNIAYQKAGVLVEGALRLGAILGGGTEEEIKALSTYGARIGSAYQLLNDINNITGAERTVGRTPGSDLSQHKQTLPVCHAISVLDTETQQRLIEVLQRPDLLAPEVGWALELITQCGSIEYSRTRAQELLTEALSCIEKLRTSEVKDLLVEMTGQSWRDRYWLISVMA